MTPQTGKVYLIGAGPGDPGLITVKGRDALMRADVVVYDRLAHPALLSYAPGAAERVFAGKGRGRQALTQEGINALNTAATQSSATPDSTVTPRQNDFSPSVEPGDVSQMGFVLRGQKYPCQNAIEIFASVFEKLAENDPTFPERLTSRKLGYKRCYLVQHKYDMHPETGYCDKYACQLKFGWFINTNVSE